jgi:hypothetical protein
MKRLHLLGSPFNGYVIAGYTVAVLTSEKLAQQYDTGLATKRRKEIEQMIDNCTQQYQLEHITIYNSLTMSKYSGLLCLGPKKRKAETAATVRPIWKGRFV